MKLKKLLLLTLLPLSLCSLSGCGGDAEEVDDDRRVLTVEFVKAGLGLTPYEKLKERFEELHPDVRISLVPTRTMDSDCATRVQSGKASDIMIYNRDFNNIRLWAKQGYIYDMKDLINEDIGDGKTMWSQLDENAKKACEFEGGYYLVPEYYNINGFVYNSTLFERMGWSVPTTTTELTNLCKTISEATLGSKSITPIVYCTEADGYKYYLDQGIATSYEGRANLDTFYEFASPEVYKPSANVGKKYGLQYYSDLYVKSGYAKNINLALTAQNELFSCDSAMMLNGSWFENENSAAIEANPNMEIKLFPVPEYSGDNNVVKHADGYTCPEGKKGVVSAEFTACMFIPAKAKNLEDAKEYMKFMCTEEACEIWTKYCNCVRPVNYDYSVSNAAYSDMSTFGKSVLEIADQYSLYVPMSTSRITVLGHGGFRPQGYWFEKLEKEEITADGCVTSDYNYAVAQWDKWVEEVESEFGE